jgi:hypothetical protein
MEEGTVQASTDRRQWSAYLFGASIFLVIWIYSQDTYEASKFFLFFALFNCLPSLVLLDLLLPRWRDQVSPPLLLIAFAPVGGLIVLLPWWAVNLKWGYYLIPVVALALLFRTSRAPAVTYKSDLHQRPQLLFVAAVLLGTPLVALALTWREGLNYHLLFQAAIAAKCLSEEFLNHMNHL